MVIESWYYSVRAFCFFIRRCSRSHPHVEEFCEHAHEEVSTYLLC